MKNFKEFYKRNRVYSILMLVSLVCIVSILVGVIVFFVGQTTKDKYGNRLDGIKSVEINSDKKNEISNKILVSGDHIESDYDEVGVMKNYLLEHGIPSEKIFVDHAGISSYDSVYRAKEIYKANKIVIVTQKYHLYRAIYIGNHLDLEVYGIAADKNIYQSQEKRDAREFLARIKDFFKCIIKPQSTYLGEVHSIKGNGINTHNK